MWCTRWYLPLLLLPFPVAPSYFLGLFLFSLTMHSRPCVYCIALLSALFVSSCYRHPIPIDTSLSMPWAENITTFTEALKASLPAGLSNIPQPLSIRPIDRCWCDISSSGIFDPYNITYWEEASVERLKADILSKVIVPVSDSAQTESEQDVAALNSTESTDPVPSAPTASRGFSWANRKALWAALKVAVWPFPLGDLPPPPPPPPMHAPVTESADVAPLKRLRREYDLRPYGFDIVLDFGWPSS